MKYFFTLNVEDLQGYLLLPSRRQVKKQRIVIIQKYKLIMCYNILTKGLFLLVYTSMLACEKEIQVDGKHEESNPTHQVEPTVIDADLFMTSLALDQRSQVTLSANQLREFNKLKGNSTKKVSIKGKGSIVGNGYTLLDEKGLEELGLSKAFLNRWANKKYGIPPGGWLINGKTMGFVNEDLFNYFGDKQAFVVSSEPTLTKTTPLVTKNGNAMFCEVENNSDKPLTGKLDINYTRSIGYSYSVSSSHAYKGGLAFNFSCGPAVGVNISFEYTYTTGSSSESVDTETYKMGTTVDFNLPAWYKKRIYIVKQETSYTETYKIPLTVSGSIATNYYQPVNGHYFWSYDILDPFADAHKGQTTIYQTITIEYAKRGAIILVGNDEQMTNQDLLNNSKLMSFGYVKDNPQAP